MSWHPTWQQHHDISLKLHLEAGRLSYSGIAAAVNLECQTHYSRNACIGRAGRLGLTNPYWQKIAALPKKTKKQQPYKPRPKRPMSIQSAEYIELECSEIIPRNLTLLELERDDCRWPYGENQDMRFCGHAQLEGSSYCRSHLNLSRKNGA